MSTQVEPTVQVEQHKTENVTRSNENGQKERPKSISPNNRAYTTLTPSCNKIIAKRWDEKRRQKHIDRLNTIKAGIDNKPPQVYQHLVHRMKKAQLEEDRRNTIMRDNQTLMNKMKVIFSGQHPKSSLGVTVNPAKPRKSGKPERRYEQIQEENLSILKRLEDKLKHHTFTDQWKQDRLTRLEYLINISAFPNKFLEEYTMLKGKDLKTKEQSSSDKKGSKDVENKSDKKEEHLKKEYHQKEGKKMEKHQQEEQKKEQQEEQNQKSNVEGNNEQTK